MCLIERRLRRTTDCDPKQPPSKHDPAMTNSTTDPSFGAGVTPPHRPQPLSVSGYGEEATPVYGEEGSLSFGERALGAYGEGLAPLPIEGETSKLTLPDAAGGRTSAFIVGESREDRYRCDICGKEFPSEDELERHVKRVGIIE